MKRKLVFFLCFFIFMFLIKFSVISDYTIIPIIEIKQDSNYDEYCETIEGLKICYLALYSGTANVFEDNQWKKVKDARSLKDKGFNIVYESNDSNYTLIVNDFNFTSIDLNISVSEAYDNKNVPLTFIFNDTYNITYDIKLKKEDKKKDKYIFDISSKVKFGNSSTQITIQDANTKNLDDSYIKENLPNGNEGSTGILYSQGEDGFINNIILKFNISQLGIIPQNITIINANVSLYKDFDVLDSGSEGWNISIHHVYSSYNWNEESISWNNGPTITTNFNATAEFSINFTGDTATGFKQWNVTDAVKINYNAKNSNVSFILNATAMIGNVDNDYIRFRSKEYSDTTIRPILYITYTVLPIEIYLGPPVNYYNNTNSSQIFNFTVNDADVNSCSLYGNWSGNWAVNQTITVKTNVQHNFTNINLPDGDYLWNVRCSRTNGIDYENQTNFTFFVIKNGPNINIIEPTNNRYSNTSVSLLYTRYVLNNPLDQCWWNYDNNYTNVSLTTSCINTTVTLANGEHQLRLYANDSNNIISYKTINYTIDTTLPSVVLNNPANGSWFKGLTNITFNYTATFVADGINRCDLQINESGILKFNISNITALKSGIIYNTSLLLEDQKQYIYNVNCSTGLGVSSFALNNLTFGIDSIFPANSINNKPINSSTTTVNCANELSFNFSAADNFLDKCWYALNYSAGSMEIQNTSTACNEFSINFIPSRCSTTGTYFTILAYTNDSAGNENLTSYSFNYEFSSPGGGQQTGGGGGGGAEESLLGKKGKVECKSKYTNKTIWSIATEYTTKQFDISLFKDDYRTRKIVITNYEETNLTLNLQCEDTNINLTKGLCRYVNISSDKINVVPNPLNPAVVSFTVSAPENSSFGDKYFFNVFATDETNCDARLNGFVKISRWGAFLRAFKAFGVDIPILFPASLLVMFFVVFLNLFWKAMLKRDFLGFALIFLLVIFPSIIAGILAVLLV